MNCHSSVAVQTANRFFIKTAVSRTEETCGLEVSECDQTTKTRACSFTAYWKDRDEDKQAADRQMAALQIQNWGTSVI